MVLNIYYEIYLKHFMNLFFILDHPVDGTQMTLMDFMAMKSDLNVEKKNSEIRKKRYNWRKVRRGYDHMRNIFLQRWLRHKTLTSYTYFKHVLHGNW